MSRYGIGYRQRDVCAGLLKDTPTGEDDLVFYICQWLELDDAI